MQRKFIYKGNYVHKVSGNTKATHKLETGVVKKGFKSSITEKDGKIVLNEDPKDTKKLDWPTSNNKFNLSGWRANNKGAIYFPDSLSKVMEYNSLKYFDTKPVFQALTVPIKVRSKLTDVAVPDSFPAQVTTGFNLGLSFGWQFTHNVFKENKNLFGKNTTKFSFTPGAFFGVGAQKLNTSNTRGPMVQIERSAFMISPGLFALIGIDRFNLGYAFGWDVVTGKNSSSWVYQGKHWHGIIVAIDLLK